MEPKTSTFSNIRFKKPVTVRFQTFSRMYFKTHSEAMAGMLDFFKYNELSPHDRLGRRMGLVIDYLKELKTFFNKRNNATIAIIRDMEKHGVLPTKAMMELLFDGGPKAQSNEAEEQEDFKFPELDQVDFDAEFQLIDERKLRRDAERELAKAQERFGDLVLKKIKVVRPGLGRPKLQLEISLEEYEALKQHYKT
ncbi:BfmA/BtgA family mobilization protein [Flagellimonas pacifica]|uniref:Uncharacterized protein n=1 Tax=Flagellimonas pacifica TaxID=1247520 RepID=A0A285MSN5_9FLAO|nr:BfmA/BtgA family mobilization protein [Allomuricauda parva]SNY99547.1 hypothetical protein SAMN06265377_1358 [Allomuricauda parva]